MIHSLDLGPLREASWQPPLPFAIESVLDDFGYAWEQVDDEDGVDFRFSVVTPRNTYPAQLILDDEPGHLRFYVFLESIYLDLDESRVIEILGRLSAELASIGSFEYNYEARFPVFRAASRLDLSADVPRDVRRLVESCAFPLELWEYVEPNLTNYSLTAKDAVAIACLKAQLVEPRDLSPRVMKALLRVT